MKKEDLSVVSKWSVSLRVRDTHWYFLPVEECSLSEMGAGDNWEFLWNVSSNNNNRNTSPTTIGFVEVVQSASASDVPNCLPLKPKANTASSSSTAAPPSLRRTPTKHCWYPAENIRESQPDRK
eukprot:TRINITY_DN67629_c2_g1_i18.p1 TRINITY_DN67629_c2_g1~~TRINITY_DN67629_c2_g1_i18.p1  ORF type:complete len:124 (+),score=16.02 TRINITY_DN67629_c2_g1_i18:101-472(+)